MATTRAQLVKWGNSLAVCIPKVIVEQAHIAEGEELEITVEGARIALETVNAKLSLETLVDAITPENLQGELDWGQPVGREIWQPDTFRYWETYQAQP
jgi:antitoxin MazE